MAPASRVWAHLDEEARTQFWATLALRHIRGLGPRSCVRLLRRFGSAHAAVRAIDQWGEARVRSDKAAQAAAGSWRVPAKEEWNSVKALDAHIILWHDPWYPELLRRLPDAPLLLYCRGDLSLLGAPGLAVVGARDCTDEGVRMAAAIARQLSACGVTIISGMAHGIDRVAHAAAMRETGRTAAVLGTGMDVVYPPANEDIFNNMAKSGLVISEFAPGTKPVAANFPIRNRIISGLALGVLVVEAALRSGSLITARLALEQNREVYAIPGPASAMASRGCQELIRQGARPVFNAEDILRDMAPLLADYGLEEKKLLHAVRCVGEETVPAEAEKMPDPEPLPDLGEDAASVLRALRGGAGLHVDTLCEATGLPPFRIAGLMTALEVDGHVRRLPGARYVLAAENRCP